MSCPAPPQLDLFDPDAELSALGVTRQQLLQWSRGGYISFEPETAPLERWMLQETAFIRDLMKVEWSVNALRQLLGSLKRPYAYDHGRLFFNFREMAWQRRFTPENLWRDGVIEAPEDIGQGVRYLIRQLALAGARVEVLKTLAVLREVLPDDWLRDWRRDQE